MNEPLAGIGILIRHALRLDRVRLVVWVLGVAFVPIVTYASYASIYPTQADRLALSATLQSNPSFSLLLGPASNLVTAGGYTAWRTIVITAVFVAVMAFTWQWVALVSTKAAGPAVARIRYQLPPSLAPPDWN